jgi:hypothetical protein
MSINAGYVNSDNLIPQTGDTLEGILLGAIFFGTANPADSANPWGFSRPAFGFANSESRKSNHFINSAQVTLRPAAWLSTRGIVGLDYIGFEDQQLARNGEACPVCGFAEGIRAVNRFQSYKYTVDLGATATFGLTRRITSKTAIGVQYNKDNLTASFNSGSVLPPGGETLSGAANKSSSEATTKFVTIGSYVDQQFGLDDRLFLNLAIRVDQNSAFGEDSRSAAYPKLSASWVALGAKPQGLLTSFRLRAAFGASGQQPGPLDAVRFYTGVPAVVFGSGLQTGVVLGTPAGFASQGAGLGNPLLKPERSEELEAGFDAGLWANKVSIEATIYRKNTKDALVQRLLPGSLGGTNSRTDNVGRIRNEGVELSVLGRLIDKRDLQWNLNLEGSLNRNRLLELADGVPPPTGFGFRQKPGYPLYGIWWPSLRSWADENGDGIIDPTEVVTTDTAEFQGTSIPTRILGLSSTLALFANRLRLGVQFEYKGGFKSFEGNTGFQCLLIQNCRAITDPNAPLEEQAKAMAGSAFGAYVEDASFIRLREANLAYTLPRSFVRSLRAEKAVITLAGRNLWHWLPNFSGWDSEINTVSGLFGDGPNYNFVQPGQPRYFTLRIALTY